MGPPAPTTRTRPSGRRRRARDAALGAASPPGAAHPDRPGRDLARAGAARARRRRRVGGDRDPRAAGRRAGRGDGHAGRAPRPGAPAGLRPRRRRLAPWPPGLGVETWPPEWRPRRRSWARSGASTPGRVAARRRGTSPRGLLCGAAGGDSRSTRPARRAAEGDAGMDLGGRRPGLPDERRPGLDGAVPLRRGCQPCRPERGGRAGRGPDARRGGGGRPPLRRAAAPGPGPRATAWPSAWPTGPRAEEWPRLLARGRLAGARLDALGRRPRCRADGALPRGLVRSSPHATQPWTHERPGRGGDDGGRTAPPSRCPAPFAGGRVPDAGPTVVVSLGDPEVQDVVPRDRSPDACAVS